MAEREITIDIKHPELIVLLSILIIVFVGFPPFVRVFYNLPSGAEWLEIPGYLQVSMNSPISFGDEGFHSRMAQWIAENVEYPVWIPFSETNLIKQTFTRPPLWNILEASFLFIFGFHEGIIRFLTPFISFLTGLAVYLLVKRLFNRSVGLIASIILVTIPSFVTYSVLFYTDILVTFYFTLAFLFFVLASKSGKRKYWILAGVYGAFAFLSKTSGFGIFIFVFLVFLYELMRQLLTEKRIYGVLRKYSVFFLILLFFSGAFILRNFYYYGGPCINLPYIDLILDNSGCVGIDNSNPKYEIEKRVEEVGTEQNVLRMGVINYLTFAYGDIWFVFLGFLGGLAVLLFKKDRVNTLTLTMLVAFLLLLSTSLGRAEDTSRYTLAWSPIIAIIAAKYFAELYKFLKESPIKTVAALVFLLISVYVCYILTPISLTYKILLIVAASFSTFYFLLTKKHNYALIIPIISIVIFFSLANLIGKLQGMEQVKRFSPLFFEACDWIRQNTDEDALISTIWVPRAMYNCQRKCTGVHADLRLSNDVNYTLEVAHAHGITHFFIQKFSLSNELLIEKYSIDFVRFLENNPEAFENIYENGPPLEQCIQQGGCDGNIVYEIAGYM